MHTMWKGSISFGLVNIPVKMFAATEDKDIRFRNIHKECHTPIKYEQVCPHCDKRVSPEEIAKGYEYQPGRFVIIEDSDLDAIRPDIAKTVEIIDFVLLKDIDPIYFAKSYYLAPQDTGGKAYGLLREAMNKTGRIAVARIVIRDKESLAVVRVYRNVLVLETIYYPDEVRDVNQVPGVAENAKLADAELNVATQLIDALTHEFEPQKYTNDYREKLMEIINKKAAGNEIVAKPEVQRTNVIDLMQALQASLQETRTKFVQGKQDKAETQEKAAVNEGTAERASVKASGDGAGKTGVKESGGGAGRTGVKESGDGAGKAGIENNWDGVGKAGIKENADGAGMTAEGSKLKTMEESRDEGTRDDAEKPAPRRRKKARTGV